MTDKKTQEKRRKLLKAVAAAGGAVVAGKTLPETWSRPAVESVVLPAHAQTSPGSFSGTLTASIDSNSMFARAMESIVKTSHADNPEPPMVDVSWCVTPIDDKTADVDILFVDAENNPPCFADLCSAQGVRVGNPDKTLSCDNACTKKMAGSEWLENLGLIKDAQASAIVKVGLEGLNPGDNIRISHDGYNINVVRQLVSGLCGPKSVDCGC